MGKKLIWKIKITLYLPIFNLAQTFRSCFRNIRPEMCVSFHEVKIRSQTFFKKCNNGHT